jgi:hypothetical protein
MARARKPSLPQPHEAILGEIRAALGKVDSLILTKTGTKKLREALIEATRDVETVVAALDPVKEPKVWFDPADPVTAGRLVAAALIAQPRVPMELVQPAYGAGVYAIYYRGDHPAYAPIAGTETPIYVGKADPASASAVTPREQGPKLSARLAEHRKTIRKVEDHAGTVGLAEPLRPIRIADFECRRLVTATNAQMYAERHLIDLFKPVWNSDTKLCWGLSMHGDTTGRNNSRPPWHVLHPGVSWALRDNIEDSKPVAEILAALAAHFVENPAFDSADHIIETFLLAFRQDPMTAASPIGDEALEELAEAGEEPGVEDDENVGHQGED